MTIAAVTLGCKVNMYETEAVLGLFREQGYEVVDFDGVADVYLVNTCTVTNVGDRKSRQMILRARRRNPNAVVAAVGCYTQVAPEAAAALGADIVAGADNRRDVVRLVEAYAGQRTVAVGTERAWDFEPLTISQMTDRARAFLKIQDGCEQYCAYCAIPYARGPARSRELAGVAEEARKLAAYGYKEIVLAGIHIASYGKDLADADLTRAIRVVHEVEGIERIRLSSVDPRLMTAEFVDFLAKSPKICNHFHLSLQSGCDRTLRAMNRRYTAAEYAAAVARLRAAIPGVAVTTDVIAGFPGETEADFEESFRFIEEIGLARLHVFPYSAKRGTKAAAMADQAPQGIRKERAARLVTLSGRLERAFLAGLVGGTYAVLVEKVAADGRREGLTTNYASASVETGVGVGEIVPVKIDEIVDFTAFGHIAGD